MRWLLTVPVTVDRQALAEEVTLAGGSLSDDCPIPLDEGDMVLFAEGPSDFPSRLGTAGLVNRVSPESEQTPYG